MFPIENEWGLWVVEDLKYLLLISCQLINQLIVSLFLHQPVFLFFFTWESLQLGTKCSDLNSNHCSFFFGLVEAQWIKWAINHNSAGFYFQSPPCAHVFNVSMCKGIWYIVDKVQLSLNFFLFLYTMIKQANQHLSTAEQKDPLQPTVNLPGCIIWVNIYF